MSEISKNEKTGLVLGGGGSKGSYQAGVCKALQEDGLKFDIVTGTSIGALVGALYASQNLKGLEDWISSMSQKKTPQSLFEFPQRYQTQQEAGSFKAFLEEFSQNGPSMASFREQYGEIFNFQALENSPMDFACLSWDVIKSEPHAFYKKNMTPQTVLDCLLASAAYFPAFNFVSLDDTYYADGGYAQTVPWSLARDMGAGPLWVVSLQDPGEIQSLPDTQVSLLVRPLLKLAYFLDFRRETMILQMKQGYLEALKYMEKAGGYLYTFTLESQSVLDRLETFLEKSPLPLAPLKPVTQYVLNYAPWELDTSLSKKFQLGRYAEVLALVCQISPYEQYDAVRFLEALLSALNHFKTDLDLEPGNELFANMDTAGFKDLIVFFHDGLVRFGYPLGKPFEVFQKLFAPAWFLALAWYEIEQFAGTLHS